MSSERPAARPFEHSFPPGHILCERYRVISRFQGGMSEVYQCLDVNDEDRFVALKTLKAQYIGDNQQRQRFNDEVNLWIGLGRHPNIVYCDGFEYEGNIPFMELEWVSAERGRQPDLRGWLAYGKFDLRRSLDVALDVCSGMLHANAVYPNGMVHLDLKPDNVLIAPGFVAKITDFGIGRVLDPSQPGSQRKVSKSTPPYMAPEQWTGKAAVDTRTDIYAVGCMLYEMLVGQTPFAGSVYELRKAHLETQPDLTLLPPEIVEVVERCLQKAQDDRFPSFNELAESLRTVYINTFGVRPVTRPLQKDFTADEYANRAMTYIKLGNYESAMKDLDTALKQRPDDAYLNAYKGLVFSQMDQHDEALRYLERAAEDFPISAQIHFMLGIAYRQAGNYQTAFESFDRAVNLDATHVFAVYQRSMALTALDRLDEAIRDITTAIRLKPDIGELFHFRALLFREKKEFNSAIADFTRALEANPPYIEAYWERANVYWSFLKRRAEALQDLRTYTEYNPDNAQVYLQLGRVYLELGNYEEAILNLTRALNLDDKQAVVFCERAYAYTETKQYDLALKDVERAIELDPKSSLPYSVRGIIYNKKGMHKEALDDFTLASQLEPHDLLHVRGRTALFADTDKFELGLDESTKIITRAPDEKWAYYVRAYFYQRLKRLDEALSDLEHAIQLDSEFAEAYLQRGMLLVDMDRPDEAETDFKRLVGRNRNNYNALVGLGLVYEKRGNNREALHYYEHAAQLGSPSGSYYYNKLAVRLEIPPLGFEPLERVFEALLFAETPRDLQQSVTKLPYLVDEQFMGTLQEAVIITRDPRRVQRIRRNLLMLRRVAQAYRRR